MQMKETSYEFMFSYNFFRFLSYLLFHFFLKSKVAFKIHQDKVLPANILHGNITKSKGAN